MDMIKNLRLGMERDMKKMDGYEEDECVWVLVLRSMYSKV